MTAVTTTTAPAATTASVWRHQREAPAARAGDSERQGRVRVIAAMVGFGLFYGVLAARLVTLGVDAQGTDEGGGGYAQTATHARPDIVDRNGETLATDIKTAALFAEPRYIIDPDEATELIAGVLPGLDRDRLRRTLASNAKFAYIQREITPRQQQAIHRLGIPGIGFQVENRRFYPGGPSASQILGTVNIDNQGIAGIEKYVDGSFLDDLHAAGFANGHALEPVRLSIDLRVQHVVRDELVQAVDRFHAISGVGIVLDVNTGEVIAMSSVPDYDPNDRGQALDPDRMNRAMVGVYEMGSTFKGFTTAMALDTGTVSINDQVDASHGLSVGGFTIHDFHGKHRWLTIPEVFIYSSNIGAGRMALDTGLDGQHEYLKRFGLLDTLRTELPETGAPIVPKMPWAAVTRVTMAYGHGISVSPMMTAAAGAALINGGYYIKPTFLPRSADEAAAIARPILKPETSQLMRRLFRLNVLKGSGRRADVPGYAVGGKTGTAEKVVKGRYSNDMRRNAFLAAFPMDAPRYLVLVVLDEPKPEKPGMGATAGMNAAPTVGAIVRRVASMLGVEPKVVDPTEAPAMALAFAH